MQQRARPRRVVQARRDSNFVYGDDDDSESVDSSSNNNKKKKNNNKRSKRTTAPSSPSLSTSFDRSRAIYALMDNWSGHRGDAVLAACGSHVSRQFVPPYSPDFNLPIEGLFGDVKRWLKRHHHYWGQPTLTTAIIERAVRECAGNVAAVLARFKRAGYAVSDAELAEAEQQQQQQRRV